MVRLGDPVILHSQTKQLINIFTNTDDTLWMVTVSCVNVSTIDGSMCVEGTLGLWIKTHRLNHDIDMTLPSLPHKGNPLQHA